MKSKQFLYNTLVNSTFLSNVTIVPVKRPEDNNSTCLAYSQTGINPVYSLSDGLEYSSSFQIECWGGTNDFNDTELLAQNVLKTMNSPVWALEDKRDFKDKESGDVRIVLDFKLNKYF